jgi:hypothetical protein
MVLNASSLAIDVVDVIYYIVDEKGGNGGRDLTQQKGRHIYLNNDP